MSYNYCIHKYQLNTSCIGLPQKLLLPAKAQILSVQQQHGAMMWALVDPNEALEERTFILYGTGHPITDRNKLKFLGTIQTLGGFAWHAFEVKT